MDANNVIEVRDVYKYFKIYEDKGNQLRQKIIHFNRNKYTKREVLKGISFDVKKGETLALIGKNGCGKSTTLKMLTGILRPNEGTIEKKGRVYSLIELGAGFHPDMTGRENIYINASIYGVSAKEVDEKLDDIIMFSELEDVIDTPVRTYSSGMYMRLAFAVAINIEADILLVDEILAVGDSAFQEKCLNRLKQLKDEGVTIVIVSHSLNQVEQICDRAIWIRDGEVFQDGPARAICKAYLESANESRKERAEKEYKHQLELEEKRKKEEEQKKKEEEKKLKEEERKKREEERKKEEQRKLNMTCHEICKQCGPDARREINTCKQVIFTKVELVDINNNLTNKLEANDVVTVKMNYKAEKIDEKIGFVVNITRNDWVYCYGVTTFKEYGYTAAKKNGEIVLTINSMNLGEGQYNIDVRIVDENGEQQDVLYNILGFNVDATKDNSNGIVIMPHKWNIQ